MLESKGLVVMNQLFPPKFCRRDVEAIAEKSKKSKKIKEYLLNFINNPVF
jgi:hypothetical protein